MALAVTPVCLPGKTRRTIPPQSARGPPGGRVPAVYEEVAAASDPSCRDDVSSPRFSRNGTKVLPKPRDPWMCVSGGWPKGMCWLPAAATGFDKLSFGSPMVAGLA